MTSVLYRLPPHLRNRTSRLVKSPKLYFSDTGLACHLAGITDIGTSHPLWGALWENYVAQNLSGILSCHFPDGTISYWNVQGRHEVDFIFEIGAETLAIEVKSGSRWQDRDLDGLAAFLESAAKCRAAILAYGGSQTFSLGKKLWVVPAQLLLS